MRLTSTRRAGGEPDRPMSCGSTPFMAELRVGPDMSMSFVLAVADKRWSMAAPAGGKGAAGGSFKAKDQVAFVKIW